MVAHRVLMHAYDVSSDDGYRNCQELLDVHQQTPSLMKLWSKTPHLRFLSIFQINVQRELRTTASRDPTGWPRYALLLRLCSRNAMAMLR